jgi:hypothetical protein
MTASLSNLRREVAELSSKLDVKDLIHFVIFPTTTKDEPHGVYGYGGFTVATNNKPSHDYACSLDFELADLKKRYNNKDSGYPQIFSEHKVKFEKKYPTFEDFLTAHKCTCGKHGAENNQPFGDCLT